MRRMCRAGMVTALAANAGLTGVVLYMLIQSGGEDFIITTTSAFGMAEYYADVAGVTMIFALNIWSLYRMRRGKRCEECRSGLR